jgi:response regulator RpfG family c-di-GMP phosphodiesterase
MSQDTDKTKKSVPAILIVDDEEIVLVALRDTLVREGYAVVASPHAVHAFSVLKAQEFSVIITDQQMPMVSGLEFLAQVREIQPNATRILITAVLNLSTLIEAINKAEIFRFVVKPWSREELLASVKSAVERFDFITGNARRLAQTLARNDELEQINRALENQVERLTRENAALRRPAGNRPPTD